MTHDPEEYPVDKWQKVASPVWDDINPNETLQYRSAREHDDERHICPLQLEVIRRGIDLWTNPNDIVLSPFAAIHSLRQSIHASRWSRAFHRRELKGRLLQDQESLNLAAALNQSDMFAVAS